MEYKEQKERALTLINKVLKLDTIKNDKALTDKLTFWGKKLSSEKVVLLVAGEFKRGKSSLINALLNEKEYVLFPVNADVATNIVTSITYGKEEKIDVILNENGKEKQEQISREEIQQYVTEQDNKGNAKNARMLVIQSPNETLADGLTIVDTPGIAVNPEHTAITYAFIPNADVVIYTTDVQAPLLETDIDFIKRIYKHCKNIVFVVTKKDLERDYEVVVERNKGIIAEALGIKEEEVKIIPVSSTAKIDYLKYEDEEDLEDSNFELLESEIKNIIGEKRSAITILPILSSIGNILINLKNPLVIEWKACQKENREKTIEKQKELQETIKQKQLFMEENATWMIGLSDGVRKMRNSINYGLTSGFSEIRSKADGYIDNKNILNKPDYLVSLVESDIDSLMIEITDNITKNVNELHAHLEDITGLSLQKSDYEDANFNLGIDTDDIRVNKTGAVEKALIMTRMGSFNATAGATISSLIGAAIGGLLTLPVGGTGAILGAQLGAGLGGIIGTVSGVRQGMDNIKDRSKINVKSKILPLINDSLSKSKLMIDDMLMNVEISMRDELRGQIKDQKTQFEKTLNNIQKTLNMNSKEAGERAKILEVKIKAADELLMHLDLLIKKVNASIKAKDNNEEEQKA